MNTQTTPPGGKPAAAAPAAAAPAAAATAANAATATPAAEKPAPAPKPEPVIQNDVRQPKAGGLCMQAWDVCSELRAKNNRIPAMSEVVEAGKAKGLNEGNLRVEYSRWKKFHGITERIPDPKQIAAREERERVKAEKAEAKAKEKAAKAEAKAAEAEKKAQEKAAKAEAKAAEAEAKAKAKATAAEEKAAAKAAEAEKKVAAAKAAEAAK